MDGAKELDLSSITEAIQRIASRELEMTVDEREAEDLVRGVLHPPRDLLRATAFGLVTRAETVQAVADRVHTWLLERSGRREPNRDVRMWEDLMRCVERALFEHPQARAGRAPGAGSFPAPNTSMMNHDGPDPGIPAGLGFPSHGPRRMPGCSPPCYAIRGRDSAEERRTDDRLR